MYQKINTGMYPNHIAIIMGGNGRWAEAREKQTSYGHTIGTKKLHEIVSLSIRLKINYLTVYAFSNENRQRPKNEIDYLMKLFRSGLDIDNFLNENNIRLSISGNIYELPLAVSTHLEECIEKTGKNTGLNLCIALNYSSKIEILHSIKKIAEKINKSILTPEILQKKLLQRISILPLCLILISYK